MSGPAQSEIESKFAELSTEAQLNLLERLVHRTRVQVSSHQAGWEEGLSDMAADPQLRRELSRINAEFCSTELDKLELG